MCEVRGSNPPVSLFESWNFQKIKKSSQYMVCALAQMGEFLLLGATFGEISGPYLKKPPSYQGPIWEFKEFRVTL